MRRELPHHFADLTGAIAYQPDYGQPVWPMTPVRAAGDGDHDGLVVVIDQNFAGRFRLPGIVEVFVEKKGSERRV